MAAEKASPKEDGKKGEPSKEDTKGKKKEEKKEVELSDEDLALKENLELMVTRSSDSKAGVAKLAMETMRSEIKSATRSVCLTKPGSNVEGRVSRSDARGRISSSSVRAVDRIMRGQPCLHNPALFCPPQFHDKRPQAAQVPSPASSNPEGHVRQDEKAC